MTTVDGINKTLLKAIPLQDTFKLAIDDCDAAGVEGRDSDWFVSTFGEGPVGVNDIATFISNEFTVLGAGKSKAQLMASGFATLSKRQLGKFADFLNNESKDLSPQLKAIFEKARTLSANSPNGEVSSLALAQALMQGTKTGDVKKAKWTMCELLARFDALDASMEKQDVVNVPANGNDLTMRPRRVNVKEEPVVITRKVSKPVGGNDRKPIF